MSHLDCMALVSKILLDSRILELRNENEMLKLKLFWKEHRITELQALMVACNHTGPRCRCLPCAVSGRKDEEDRSEPWGAECTFKAWFEQQLESHCLTVVTGVAMGDTHVEHECSDGVYDVDAHFHQLARDDWVSWTYGAKLWKAETVDNPDIKKLQKLFHFLREFSGFY